MTLRLKRHDEIIDAMAEALLANRNRSSTKKATAALDALLEAAVRLGVAEIADVDGVARPYSIIALRLEASDDK